MAASTDKFTSYIPRAGLARDGWSTETEATATCFCGSVQLSFVSLATLTEPIVVLARTTTRNTNIEKQPTEGPGLVNTFVCNCYDCRKITASMFASNFTIADTHLQHLRGRDNLKTFAQSETIGSHQQMTNYFCSTCGTLMYRVGAAFPGMSILRIGTVDDFKLHETKLKPAIEQYTKDRVSWFSGVDGAKKAEAMFPY
ncbi:Mss4-like protein [Paramyrothecium foliicola]|nr:Mss4-like protein [Paramyrothecium foliicola]